MSNNPRRKHVSESLLALAAVFLIVTAGCGDELLPSTDAASAHPDVVSDVPPYDVPPGGDVVVMPQGATFTAEEAAAATAKYDSGADFIDMRLRPNVAVASQSACDGAIMERTRMRLPRVGNENLLGLKIGSAFVGNRADSAKRKATGSNNVFGFMRIVDSVRAEGGWIIIETHNARLEEVLVGAMQISTKAETAEVIDTTGVDMSLYFDGREPMVPLSGEYEQKEGPLSLSKTFSWGASVTKPVLKYKKEKKIGDINIEFSLDGTLDAAFSFKPSFKLAADIQWVLPKVKSIRAGAEGSLNLSTEAKIDMQLSMSAGREVSLEEEEETILQVSPKSDEAPPGEWTLATLGPYAGPVIVTIPTTFEIEFIADCGFNLQGKVEGSVKASASAAASFYVIYKDGKWTTEKSSEFTTSFSKSLTASASAVVECGVAPQVNWLIGGVGGPYVALRAFGRGTAKGYIDCPPPETLATQGSKLVYLDLDVDAGIQLLLGGKVDVKVDTYEFGPFTLWEKVWKLYQKTLKLATVPQTTCPSNCESSSKNGIETDVDCGGGVCPKCALGQGCEKHTDCADGGCYHGICQINPCKNKIEDTKYGEIDVDCGGDCKGCPLGGKCKNDSHCAVGTCSKLNICAKLDCNNNVWDEGIEAYNDCGSACGSEHLCWAGARCYVDADCQTGLKCVPYTNSQGKKYKMCSIAGCHGWMDGKKDEGEGDVDCGGPCMSMNKMLDFCTESGCGKFGAYKCLTGQNCYNGVECASKNCIKGKCAPPKCLDGLVTGKESDVDCGGGCEKKCSLGKKCNSDSDCGDELSCSGPNKDTCTPIHADGRLNGGETGIDCGGKGKAPRCDLGGYCKEKSDCMDQWQCFGGAFGAKYLKRCVVPGTCDDGKLNLNETDVDCGGGCGQCAWGKACKVYSECVPGDCIDVVDYKTFPYAGTFGKCMTTCENGKLDSQKGEGDIDCAGPVCPSLCGVGKTCNKDAHCESGWCKGNYKDKYGIWLGNGSCQSPTCDDGRMNAAESDTDCGGDKCDKCPDNKVCLSNADCESAFCSKVYDKSLLGHQKHFKVKVGRCKQPSCTDKEQGGTETDVDCGGDCTLPCLLNKGCKTSNDCKTGLVCADKCVEGKDGKTCDKRCLVPVCGNGKLDAGEADVDCGGPDCVDLCPDGKSCTKDEQCLSGQCVGAKDGAGKCGFDPCADGKKSYTESDLDCGGACGATCALAATCDQGKDCKSGFCSAANKCVASACQDGQLSGDESDVDCGGSCQSKCATGKAGKQASDCESGFSNGDLCVADACADLALSATETDVDCGGPCAAKCALKQGCKVSADCQSNVCNGSVCVAGSCFDKKKTDGETDVDCGGACKAKCSTGKACKAADDCVSGICSAAGTCVLSTCDDGQVSGDETDLDCGGSCKTDCLNGKKCKTGVDCASTLCAAKSLACVADACLNEAKDGQETDLDCGGDCAQKCGTDKGCKAGADCMSGICAGDKCGSCGCDATGAIGDVCDAKGQCECKPGWGALKCDKKVDVCVADKLQCDDKNPCTKDSCDKVTGCANAALADGTSCGGAGKCGGGSCKCEPGNAFVDGKCAPCACSVKGTDYWTKMKELSGEGVLKGSRFGTAAAMTDKRLLFGAPAYNDGELKSGVGMLYEADGFGGWKKVANLAPSQTYDNEIGRNVAVNDNYAVLQGKRVSNNITYTTVWTFQRQLSGEWVELGALVGGQGRPGEALALDATTLVVGAPSYTAKAAPTALVTLWERDAGKWVTKYNAGGVGVDKYAAFGSAVALDGPVVAVGAPKDKHPVDKKIVGSVSILEKVAGKWSHVTRLVPPVDGGAYSFGSGLALDGGLLAVASSGQTEGSKLQGRIWFYKKGADGKWTSAGQVGAKATVYGNYFGESMAFGAGNLLVGLPALYNATPGKSRGYVVVYGPEGDSWKQRRMLGLPAGVDAINASFGKRVLFHKGQALVTAPGQTTAAGANAGSAWMLTPFKSCDDVGQCACNQGWSGNNCDQVQDACKVDFLNCDDGNGCVADTCDNAKISCVHTPLEDGAACEEGDLCTSGDTCKASSCVAGGKTDCDDKNVCTIDSCVSATGCQHLATTPGLTCGGDTGWCGAGLCRCQAESYWTGDKCQSCGCDAQGTASPAEGAFIAGPVDWTPDAGVAVKKAGTAVAMQSDLMAIGAPGTNDAGAVGVFTWQSDGTWKKTGLLQGGGAFGSSVALVGDKIVVGAPVLATKGRVYSFTAGAGGKYGGTVVEMPTLTSLKNYGYAVAVTSEHLIVGAPMGKEGGHAYALWADPAAGGKWKLKGEVGGAGAPWSSRGFAVDVDKQTAAIGDAGGLWLYRYENGSWKSDGKMEKVMIPALTDNGETLLGGEYKANLNGTSYHGQVKVWTRGKDGTWAETGGFTHDLGRQASFGRSLSVFGDLVLVGAEWLNWDDNKVAKPGGAFLFARGSDGKWTQRTMLQPPMGKSADAYGLAVALGAKGGVIGMPSGSPAGRMPVLVSLRAPRACDSKGACACKPTHSGPQCKTDLCANNKSDGSETDVDCGGSCSGKCLLDKGCKVGADCSSGYCGKDGKCACTPGWGGGEKCDVKVDVCVADKLVCDDGNTCTTDSCDPKAGCQFAKDDKNKCSDGSKCTVSNICVAGVCKIDKPVLCVDDGSKCTVEACDEADGKCKAPALVCDDKQSCTVDTCDKDKGCVYTDSATDVNCGGTCAAKCALTKKCIKGDDCSSGICSTAGICVATTCENGIKDAGEIDVDCAGPCKTACANGKTCTVDSHCLSTFCASDGKCACRQGSYFDGGQSKCVGCGCNTSGVKDPYNAAMVLGTEQAVTASDAGSLRMFGAGVAIRGDRALIGSPGSSNSKSGSAYVFDLQGDGTWKQTAQIKADDASIASNFGQAVAVDGEFAAIGAKDALYIFALEAGTWKQKSKVTKPVSKSVEFGKAVAITRFDSANQPYTYAVALAGMSDNGNKGTKAGAVYSYYRVESGAWKQGALGYGYSPVSYARFGSSIAASPGLVLVGAPGRASGGKAGGGMVIATSTGPNGGLNTGTAFWPTQPQNGLAFGTAVGIYGKSLAIVGTPSWSYAKGQAYIFELLSGKWTEMAKLSPPAPISNGLFGASVAISDDVAVVGWPGNYDQGNAAGAAALFHRSADGSWPLSTKVLPKAASTNDKFGSAVGVTGRRVFIGGPYDATKGSYAGAGAFYKDGIPACDGGGQCSCATGWSGKGCDACPGGNCSCPAEMHFDKASKKCADCGCKASNSTSLNCDGAGKCTCKSGYSGDKCDKKIECTSGQCCNVASQTYKDKYTECGLPKFMTIYACNSFGGKLKIVSKQCYYSCSGASGSCPKSTSYMTCKVGPVGPYCSSSCSTSGTNYGGYKTSYSCK